jgi:hypothetical protein
MALNRRFSISGEAKLDIESALMVPVNSSYSVALVAAVLIVRSKCKDVCQLVR